MRLVHAQIQFDIELLENQVNILIIESPQKFSEVIMEISGQMQGKEGLFVLSERDKILNFSKEAELIFHPFLLDCNEKRIQQKLYQLLTAEAEENFFLQTNQINADIVSYLDNLIENVPYALSYDLDGNLAGLLKLYSVRIDDAADSLLEKLLHYLRAAQEFCQIRVFFFVNLKTYLNKEELEQLYEFAFYQKLQLILLENVQRTSMAGEKVCILDKDMCIIEW